ncbi:MAG TPA: 3-hydroxyacyl-CoA dehydrogenase family protein, partial [Puia sp.]
VEELRTFFPGPDNTWVVVKTIGEAPSADLYIDLDFEPSRAGELGRLLPMPIFVNAVIPTLEEIGRPFVRINGWPGFLNRPVHELTVKDASLAEKLPALYEKLGCSYRIVPDTPGMISSRILATIINEAYYTWEEAVSSQEEIDIAMKLGTNYPTGPFEWAQQIGLKRVTKLLNALSKTNDRYTPAASLVKAAAIKI